MLKLGGKEALKGKICLKSPTSPLWKVPTGGSGCTFLQASSILTVPVESRGLHKSLPNSPSSLRTKGVKI